MNIFTFTKGTAVAVVNARGTQVGKVTHAVKGKSEFGNEVAVMFCGQTAFTPGSAGMDARSGRVAAAAGVTCKACAKHI